MGTPGHMAHPFDVEKFKTGQDLIDYIQDAVLRLQNQEIAGRKISEILTSLFVSITAILSIIVFYNVIISDYYNKLNISPILTNKNLNLINLFFKLSYKII